MNDVRTVLSHAIALEAGIPAEELATDQPFTAYGLDSMAALTVGLEIEDSLGLTDLPVNLLWDHPTVDSLSEALWKLMNHEPATISVDGP